MFKKLKSLFVIEEEGASEGSNNDSTQVNDNSKSSPSAESNIEISKPVFDKSNPQRKLDEKFVNRLLGAIEEKNMDGFDYLEYKQALQNLNKVQMDEPTKYKSALAVAQTMGANKKVLSSSAQHYLDVLKREEDKFLDAFKNQISQQVTLKSEEIQAQESSIEQMKTQIVKLQEEIEKRRQQLQESRNSVDEAKEKVEATKNDFYQAYYVVTEQIKSDLEKINKYLLD